MEAKPTQMTQPHCSVKDKVTMEAKLTQMTQPQSLSESACTAQFRIRLQRMLKGTVSQEILTNFFA